MNTMYAEQPTKQEGIMFQAQYLNDLIKELENSVEELGKCLDPVRRPPTPVDPNKDMADIAHSSLRDGLSNTCRNVGRIINHVREIRDTLDL